MPVAHPVVKTHGRSSAPTAPPSRFAASSTTPYRQVPLPGSVTLSYRLRGLDGLAAGDPQQLVVARREDRVRMAGGGPDRVVAREADIDERPDRLQVPHRRDSADNEPGPVA